MGAVKENFQISAIPQAVSVGLVDAGVAVVLRLGEIRLGLFGGFGAGNWPVRLGRVGEGIDVGVWGPCADQGGARAKQAGISA